MRYSNLRPVTAGFQPVQDYTCYELPVTPEEEGSLCFSGFQNSNFPGATSLQEQFSPRPLYFDYPVL
jgi:hypothetical protein